MLSRLVLALVVSIAPALAQTPPAPDRAASQPALDAQLATINRQFRANYALAVEATLARTRPVIVVAFDRLIVLTRAGESTIDFTPPIYDRMKSIAHIPLAIHTIVAPSLAGADDPGWRARLADLRAEVTRLTPLLDGFDVTRTDRRRQREIVLGSLDYMNRVLGGEELSSQRLDAFADDLAPAMLGNAYDAAEAQIDGLHEAVQALRASWNVEDWARVKIVVLGPKVAREGNLQYEYFARILGRAAIQEQLIYAEGIFDRARGLDLLARIMHDRAAADSFFGERLRLDRDLLADATARILDRKFGPRR